MPRLTTALTDKELRKKLRDLERVGEPETFSVGGVAGLCVVWKSPAKMRNGWFGLGWMANRRMFLLAASSRWA